MPRQRLTHRRAVHVFPEDFAESLERIREASGLSWNELARRLGTSPLTVRRWRQGVRPNAQHLFAIMNVAADLGLIHLLPTGRSEPHAQPALPGLDSVA
ncbi:MAG: helix-turn-helix domain-containing protein [Chloroflexi bacterium]|nr:helix-turn-helix domain-containing protein [Chloroflexota bacterium]